jgi:hypothetical protein
MNRVVFRSMTDEWKTPISVYASLHKEFDFNDDPCPINGVWDGLYRAWGERTFCNPPYSQLSKWMAKAFLEWSVAGNTVVLLIPSRTDTRWWHEYVMKATEIRFIKGRLRFGDAKTGAPFPSCVVVFRRQKKV